MKQQEQQMIEILSRYVPEGMAPICVSWIIQEKVQFTVKPKRNSILGDYRHPYNGKGHRISVNGSLNPYNFLVTFVHEFAHLHTWKQHKGKVAPHGPEWKNNYTLLMQPFLDARIFPEDIHHTLVEHMQDPSASSCTDPKLLKVMGRYDENPHRLVHLEELPDGSVFMLEDGRIFKKISLLRKYYRCIEQNTGTTFRINGLAKVKPLKQPSS